MQQLLHSNILGVGKPFVILHGFLGMGDNWKTLGSAFADEGFEVHLVDQRNHGRSFHDKDFDYELLASDLKYYCDHNKLKNVILLGHSMGGKTAMLFAATNPGYVSKLIIADIAPRFYPKHHQYILEGLSALDFTQIKSRGQADKALSKHISEPSIRQFLLKNLYWKQKDKLALRMNLDALIDNIDEIGEALPKFLKFEGDTLFLRGDRSEYISLNDESLIKAQFPNAKIETIDHAGHWLHAENPEQFLEKVLQFVNQV